VVFSLSDVERSARLPVRALSGRTGRPLWAAGPLPGVSPPGRAEEIDVDDRPVVARIEPNGMPDVVVLHGRRSSPAGSPMMAWIARKQQRLARLSGRDGRVVWDIGLKEFDGPRVGSAISVAPLDIPLIHFGDLDGDGSLDAVYVNTPTRFTTLGFGSSMQDIELQAVSLKGGERLWSHRFPIPRTGRHQLLIAIGDLDGDRRAEVIVANAMEGQEQALSQLNALDGPDGRVLWTWTGVTRKVDRREDSVELCLLGVGRGSRQAPCVMVSMPKSRRLVMLDARGHETARRDLPPDNRSELRAADLDGDGSDELMLASKEGLRVFRADLQEAWSRRPLGEPQDLRHRPASSGRPGAVILPPAFGLDGTDGHPLWSGQPGPPGHGLPRLLDWDGPGHRPLWMVGAPGAPICRAALPVTSAGGYAPPRGTPVPPGLARRDPRWARPLPWIEPIRRALDPPIPLIVIGLAVVNVALPIGIIRLAARRRPWSLRLLMALPVAAAIPLAMVPAFGPLIPARIGLAWASARRVFVLATLAGTPIVMIAGFVVTNLFRRRGKPLAWLLGLTIVAAAVIAAAWVRIDLRNMPAIEHYDRSGWSLATLPGAYAAGVLLILDWPIRRMIRRLKQPGNRPSARPN
jgi:hypothetical protein